MGTAPVWRSRSQPVRGVLSGVPDHPRRVHLLSGHFAGRLFLVSHRCHQTRRARGWNFRQKDLKFRRNAAQPFQFEDHVMAKGAGKARKKLPPELAVVNADNCTGCEACIEVCPVDCIYKVPGEDLPSLQSFVDIDLERCIGCKLCERWCPWDAIDMVDTVEIAVHVANKGGPAEYVEKNWERLVGAAQAIAELALEQQKK